MESSGKQINKKIIIIGAGISGLTAGVYARKAGFETEIYEAHTVAGGECTGWNRHGYHIDGCIHWLTGTKEGTDLYRIWETTGALGKEADIYHYEYILAVSNCNETYYLYTDLTKLEKELLRISPADEVEIKKLIKSVGLCQNLPIPAKKPMEYMSLFDKMSFMSKYIKVGKLMSETNKITVKEYLERFQSPVIRQLLSGVVPLRMPANTFFFSLGTRTNRNGSWPIGGSYQMAQRMKQRFEKLGGTIYLGMPVQEILVEEGKAFGIRLNNGEIHHADYIVPAVDADILLNQLLEGKIKDEYFEKRFSDIKSYQLLSSTLIALGINADLHNYPHELYIKLGNPLQINNSFHDEFAIKHYGYDSNFSKDGRSLITVTLDDKEGDYWQKLRHDDIEQYKNEKNRIAQAVIAEIGKVYPELKEKIEMIDVATPSTFNRYCGAYKGAYMSFSPAPGVKSENHKGVFDGIDNLYLAGQWAFPDGGLPMATIAGKFAIQRICKKEKMNIID